MVPACAWQPSSRIAYTCQYAAHLLDATTPLDFLFYLAIINNAFSVFGLAGVLTAQREFIVAFFTYNTLQMVVAFRAFVPPVVSGLAVVARLCTTLVLMYCCSRSSRLRS